MERERLKGRIIFEGKASGEVIVSAAPLSFYGGLDLERGVVSEAGHPLEGKSVAGKILVFPTGKGSTVGSYALLRLSKTGLGPAAMIMESCDTTVAVGAIIAEIPCVDQISLEALHDGDQVTVEGSEVRIS